MAGKNGKKIFLGALSAIAASVAAGTMIKNKISEKNKKNKKENIFRDYKKNRFNDKSR